MSSYTFEKAKLENDYSDHLRIVLIGKTGKGKSSTANSIVGTKAFETAASADSVTKECEAISFELMNRKILLVDTIGIGDTNRPEHEILDEMKKIIEFTYPGPNIFVIVLSTQRLTNEEKCVIELISNFFGKQIYNHSMIIFTRLDDLEHENTNLNTFVEQCQIEFLRQLVNDCKSNYLGINNRWKMDSHEMTEFRKNFMEMILNIIESNNQNNDQIYTADQFKESVKHYEYERKKKERERLEEEERKQKLEQEIQYQQFMISQMQNGVSFFSID